MSRFERSNFESSEFLIEAVEAPKIKPGGSSSSNVLNRYFNALSQDLALLATRSNILAERVTRVASCVSLQSGALLATFQSLSTRVDYASAYSQVLADIHSQFYITTGSTTAELNTTFGQATLPVLSRTDLLVQTDVYGNKYISPEIETTWARVTNYVPGNTAVESHTTDPQGIYMLRDEQPWIVPAVAGTYVHFKIKAPLQFRGLIPNVLEIWPFPAFATNLFGVWYQKVSDNTANVWYELDKSYLPRYNSGVGNLQLYGPIRFHLPNEPITQLVIGVNGGSSEYVGIKKLKMYHVQYESSATLVVKDPFSRTIGDTLLLGKDPSDLSLLSTSKSGSEMTITLTTTDSTVTPVITGVIMDV